MLSKPTVFCFPNGNVAFTGRNGEQVPKLQRPWILLLALRIEEAGIDPSTCEWLMPDGRRAEFFKTADGYWNWEMI